MSPEASSSPFSPSELRVSVRKFSEYREETRVDNEWRRANVGSIDFTDQINKFLAEQHMFPTSLAFTTDLHPSSNAHTRKSMINVLMAYVALEARFKWDVAVHIAALRQIEAEKSGMSSAPLIETLNRSPAWDTPVGL